jgi:hypothetical protein
MSYIILEGRWRHIIVLKFHAQREDKTDDVENSFYEKLERVFDKFHKYYKKILLGRFSAQEGREDFFKPTIKNESLHEISNHNGVRIVNVATSKISQSKVRCSHMIHKYSWTSSDGKQLNQIDNTVRDSRRHSSILDVVVTNSGQLRKLRALL